jgi:hypothetical protein
MSDQKHKEGKMMKPRTKEEAVQIDQLPWKPFPDAYGPEEYARYRYILCTDYALYIGRFARCWRR